LERLLQRHEVEDYEAEWAIMGDPFRSPAGKLRAAVVESVEAVLGLTPELNTGGGTSDGRYIAPLGTEVLELGLINESIHQVDERTPVADRFQARTSLLLRAAANLLIVGGFAPIS
jgi:succinyl-diaminopimelate desuccinylase